MQAGTEVTLHHHRPPSSWKMLSFSLSMHILANRSQSGGLYFFFNWKVIPLFSGQPYNSTSRRKEQTNPWVRARKQIWIRAAAELERFRSCLPVWIPFPLTASDRLCSHFQPREPLAIMGGIRYLEQCGEIKRKSISSLICDTSFLQRQRVTCTYQNYAPASQTYSCAQRPF